MKVLITGAQGQLGRALAAYVPFGWDYVGLGRTECDLASEASIRAAIATHRPDVVLNAAAYTAVDRAEVEEAQAMAVNGRAPGILREALREYGGRLVHISTDFVFDGAKHDAYQPSDPCRPLCAYGRSKAAGEHASGPDALVIRTSWLYAAGGTNFVRTMLRMMRENYEVRVVADQIAAPTWAARLAKTIWALTRKDARGFFHHRDGGIASWYDFAVAIQEEALRLDMLKRSIPIIPIATSEYPTPARRPAFSLLDDAATRDLLGDNPPHWRVNLRLMLKEEKALGQIS